MAGVRGGQHRTAWRRAWAVPATAVETHDDLLKVLDDVVPTLAARTEPLVLEVAVVPETTFAP